MSPRGPGSRRPTSTTPTRGAEAAPAPPCSTATVWPCVCSRHTGHCFRAAEKRSEAADIVQSGRVPTPSSPMRPLSTRRSDEAGEADQATSAGAAPVRENGAHGDGEGTQVTNEIQAPAAAPTRVDHAQVDGSPEPLAAAATGPGERGRLRRRLRKLKTVRATQRAELGTLV